MSCQDDQLEDAQKPQCSPERAVHPLVFVRFASKTVCPTTSALGGPSRLALALPSGRTLSSPSASIPATALTHVTAP